MMLMRRVVDAVNINSLQWGDPCQSAEVSIVMRPSTGWRALNIRELWEFRELLYFLAVRDIKVRYKQTMLGAVWAILQPLLTMIVFSVIFGRLGHMPSDGLPYPIFAYTALLPWQLFSYSVTQSGSSLISNQNLISKVYFPRLVIPTAPILAGLLDFSIAFVVLLGMMPFYGLYPTWRILLLPMLLAWAVVSCLGVGIWLSAMNITYRDIRYATPFLIQFWMFVTPVAYSTSVIPKELLWVYGLNPLTGIIEGFRWVLFGNTEKLWLLAVSAPVVLIVLISGLYYFKRTERVLADQI